MKDLFYNLNFNFPPLKDMTLRTDCRHYKVHEEEINPLLIQTLEKVGIKVWFSEVFYSNPGFSPLNAHIDGSYNSENFINGWPSRCKLNFVYGNPSTVTTWCDVPIDLRIVKGEALTPVNSSYLAYELRKCTNILSANLQGWHLFEAGVPHYVKNSSQFKRWCVSFTLSTSDNRSAESMEEIKNRLKEYSLL